MNHRPRRCPCFVATLTLAMTLGLLACGAGGATSSDPADPPPQVEACPLPGAGISVGGEPGSGADTDVPATRRLVLMGGGSEDDAAATRFVEAAGGGDVLILRATGSLTSYPSYFTGGLSPQPPPASVVTVLTTIPSAAADPAVLCWIGRAEAVWLAGGDQWDYLGRWPAAVHTALRELTERRAAVGGTSAGAVSLGEAAFDAELGTVTSEEALADPLRPDVSISYPPFAQPELAGVLVDSHFMDRGREGRLLAFLARFLAEKGHGAVVGVGLDEGVAFTVEGGAFQVSTTDSGAAWLYEVEGPVELTPGEPLNLNTVRRLRLAAGSAGTWPPDFTSPGVQPMRVEAGVIILGFR